MLFTRVAPRIGESLTGYLIRSAAANHESGPGSILKTLFGSAESPSFDEAESLALYCRCKIDEVTKLIGFGRRTTYGRQWYVNGDWVTKEYFVSPRSPAVCARCLSEEPFIQGSWDFTLNVACPFHGCKLVQQCPACRRSIPWNRNSVYKCLCGFDLRNISQLEATFAEIYVAQLIVSKMGFPVQIPPLDASPCSFYSHLSALTLDGLFKAIWFLGHILPTLRVQNTVRGRKKPNRDEAAMIVANAMLCLTSWPAAYFETLQEIQSQTKNITSAARIDRTFTSAYRYLNSELSSEETAFLRIAFEQHIRHTWTHHTPTSRLRAHFRQYELDFN